MLDLFKSLFDLSRLVPSSIVLPSVGWVGIPNSEAKPYLTYKYNCARRARWTALTDLRLKDAYVELCQRYGPNYYITLATNQTWGAERMAIMLCKFAEAMDQSGLGRKWFKRPIVLRADGVCFIEKPEINLHAHCVLRIPYGLPNVSEIWEGICPSGSVDTQEITTEGFGAYCAKEMELRRFAPDQIVLLSDFMSATSHAASNTSLR